MPKRIRKPPSKKGGKWGNYVKKGLELGALGAVQFVPGLDVAADAAVAGEAVEATEGAKEAETAYKASNSLLRKGAGRLQNYAKQQAQGYVQQAQNYAKQQAQGYLQQAQMPYRQSYMNPRYRQPMMPSQVGGGYRQPYYPPPKKPFLGPLEKKIILYGFIFICICVVILIVIRSISNHVDGYYHSSSGCHCKKNNHCGSHKKHRSNCGSHTKNGSGHNSCGGS